MNRLQAGTALALVIVRYVQCKRALGRDYLGVERILGSLLQFMDARAAEDLDQNLFAAWSQSFAGLSANVRRNRQREVRNLCLYRQRTEPGCFVPDANRFPRPQPYRAPVIFGADAVARMLAVAEQQQPTPGSPLLPAVLRLAVVLLYTAGLRRGELLNLTLADADPAAGVLRIRESKFHKSRFVPLLRWYRQGADVQSNLPKLAMYMGHVSIVSTAYYLQWMPDIAAAASERFEARFGHLISGGNP